jgi:DNA invertase Pin-like site-specific DNA recombinase
LQTAVAGMIFRASGCCVWRLRAALSVKRIADAKTQFRFLTEPWADTGTSTGRLMLAVLGGLADVERDLIRTRTAEGRSRAKVQGKHVGLPFLAPAQRKEAIRPRAQGATLDELARGYNVSRTTISRLRGFLSGSWR